MIKYAVNVTRVLVPHLEGDAGGYNYSVQIARPVYSYLAGLYNDEDKAIEKQESLEEFLSSTGDIVSVYVSEVEID